MKEVLEFIKKNRTYIMYAGCAIMAIAVFLTFFKITSLGQTSSVKFKDLTDHGNEFKVITGYLVLVAAIISAVLIYLKKEMYSLISTGAAFVITFYDYFKVKDNSAFKLINALGGKTTYIAPWIVLLGALVAACPIIIDILEKKDIIKTK